MSAQQKVITKKRVFVNAIAFILVPVSSLFAVEPGLFLVKLQVHNLSASGKIISAKIEINPGQLARLDGIPIGWEIHVDNELKNKVVMTGGGSLTSTAVSEGELSELQFYIREYDDTTEFPRCGGELSVTADFSHVKTIQIGSTDCVVSKISRK